jgi:hypothetical protein
MSSLARFVALACPVEAAGCEDGILKEKCTFARDRRFAMKRA